MPQDNQHDYTQGEVRFHVGVVCVCEFVCVQVEEVGGGGFGTYRGILSAVKGGLVNMQRTSKLNQTAKLSISG